MSTDKSESIINPHASRNNNDTSSGEPNKNSHTICSVADSAYDSLVCSPFSPIIISNAGQPNNTSIDYQLESLSNPLESMSPFLESGETDEVFQMSLEQIYTDRSIIAGVSTSNSIFRPISSDREINRNSIGNVRNYDNSPSNVALRQNMYSQSAKSHRSISTQTKFSLNSIGFYRPSSAPLQEGIEEELSEIETSEISMFPLSISRLFSPRNFYIDTVRCVCV